MNMTKSTMELEKILNREQFLSVTKIEGPSLILAGAGSGKTRVITYKIAYMVEQGVSPGEILAVTFTNKAAKEMKERVGELLKKKKKGKGTKKKGVMVTTFHSLGLFILKNEIQVLGYKRKFSIYDDKDAMQLIKEVLKELKLPEDVYDPYELTYKISNIKMNMKAKIEDPALEQIYKKYQDYLKIYNAVDFDDLIMLPIEILSKNEEILAKYHKRWKYILVDEYQDTSLMQYKFIKMIASKHKNISVVGDDDQSIYSWRGANSQNITLFERDFYPIYEVKLEQNYRSTATILNAANAIITQNSDRREKNLWTSGAKGEKISFYEAEDEETEADYLLMMIKRLKDEGVKYNDMGILFRMNALSRPIEEKLRENDIPYTLIGGMKFFERPEIRDMLSYMRFLANTDDEVALSRIINNPKRGIGNTTIMALMEYSKEHNAPIFSCIKQFINLNLMGNRVTPYLEDFHDLIEKYREMIFKPRNIARTVKLLVDEIDYKGKLLSELKNVTKLTYRMHNINQLCQSISRYEKDPDNFNPSIFEYLQRVSLQMREDDKDNEKDSINMLSIHSSKGLEYKVVFVVGVEDGLIPHWKTIEEVGTDAEERRLFYVAVTRAREKLFLSYPRKRMKFNEALNKEQSTFIKDIPEELLEFVDLEQTLGKKDALAGLLDKMKSGSL